VSELFFFFLYKWNWACSDKFLLFVIMNQNEFYLFSFQCWVGIWSLLIKEGLRVFFFFFFVENLELWKLQVLSILKNQYLVSLTIMNILVWHLNLEWPHVSFTCCQKVAPKIYPSHWTLFTSFFCPLQRTQQISMS
jgi:hypothetical protein